MIAGVRPGRLRRSSIIQGAVTVTGDAQLNPWGERRRGLLSLDYSGHMPVLELGPALLQLETGDHRYAITITNVTNRTDEDVMIIHVEFTGIGPSPPNGM